MFSSNRIPGFWPKGIYYGWAIVATSLAVNLVQTGQFNPALAVFIIPFNEEFGWSRTEISAAIAIGSIWGGLLAPLSGPLLDRRGPRMVLVAGQIFFGAALILASMMQELWHFYATFNLGRAVVLGVTSIAIPVSVANWFYRDRPFAMGITQLGGHVGQALLPLAVQIIIDTAGWRWAFVFLGMLVFVVGVLPAAVFLRRRPEDVGLQVDGRPMPVATDAAPGVAAVQIEEEPWTTKEASRTWALWILVVATSVGYMVGGGINLHMVPFFIDRGIPSIHAVGSTTVLAASAGLGGVFWGWFARKLPAIRYALAILYVCAAASMMAILTVNTTVMAYVVSTVFGLAFGGMFPIINSLWPDYFGRRSLGAITGLITPFQLGANAAGPFIAGLLYDTTGNYEIAFTIFAGAYALAAVWVLMARQPKRRTPTATPARAA